MGAVDTSIGRIGVDERGGGAATPIVFLHGVGSDKSVWRPQIDAFGVERRALAFDYPGYGDSDFLVGATREDFARAVFAALDALGIEHAHICGLSLGGVIAIAMHAAGRERCASLILADTFAVHPEGRAIYDRSIDASRTLGMAALAEARAGSLLAGSTGEEIRREVIATMSRIDPAAYAIGAEAVWLASQVDEAREITVPTLILVGAEDMVTPPALSDELARLIPHAALEVIPGAGHLPNIEQPSKFNAAIRKFLSKID